jgi:GAF domain-containing protein
MDDSHPEIWRAFDGGPADEVFASLMPAMVEALDCDRCFLYLRDPRTRRGGTVACASREDRWPDLRRPFEDEPDDLPTLDPLMGLAFRTPEAVFVEDIEAEGPDVLDLAFEREGFGHKALVHAPIYDDGELVGILEPCTFGAEAHPWTPADRKLVAAVQARLGPVAGGWLRAAPR